MTPVKVTVCCSESHLFPYEGITYTFQEFEHRAAQAALRAGKLTNPVTGEEYYPETHVIVLFDTGVVVETHIALAAEEFYGIEDLFRSKLQHESEMPEDFKTIQWISH